MRFKKWTKRQLIIITYWISSSLLKCLLIKRWTMDKARSKLSSLPVIINKEKIEVKTASRNQ